MSINLNDNLIIQAPKAIDKRYGPYASEAAALLAISPVVRHRGLTAGVWVSGSITDYWFKDGISDSDFVVKTSGNLTPLDTSFGFACSDEHTNLTTGLKFTFHFPQSVNLTKVFLSVNEAPTGSSLIVDVKLNATSIFSTLPSINADALHGGNSAIFSTLYLPFDGEITIFIDQVGSASPGKGLKVWLLGNKTPCDLPSTGIPGYSCVTDLNTSCVNNFNLAWYDCTSLYDFPLLDVSSGSNFNGAWNGCSNLTYFPPLNLKNGTNFGSFSEGGLGSWGNCCGLTTFPAMDFSSGVNFQTTWAYCKNLSTFPEVDLSSGRVFDGTWAGCEALSSFPALNLSSGVNFWSTWSDCTGLINFPANMFDNCQTNYFPNTWFNCALSQQSVDNILVSLDTSGKTDGSVNINGGTSSPPGEAGLAAKASLESKGWTVLVNASPPPSTLEAQPDPLHDSVIFLSGFNGANESTIIIDEGPLGLPLTTIGSAKISSNQSVFGCTSLSIEGPDRSISGGAPSDAEHGVRLPVDSRLVLSGDFTVDARCRFNSVVTGSYGDSYPRSYMILGGRAGGPNTQISVGFQFHTGKLNVLSSDFMYPSANFAEGTAAPNTWYALRWARKDNVMYFFADGILLGSGGCTGNFDLSGGTIGSLFGNSEVDGFIDELRITNQCRSTENYTIPTFRYSRT